MRRLTAGRAHQRALKRHCEGSTAGVGSGTPGRGQVASTAATMAASAAGSMAGPGTGAGRYLLVLGGLVWPSPA